MQKISVLALLAAFALSACAEEEPVVVVKWSKSGASYDGFVAVRALCIQEVRIDARPFYLADAPDPGKPGPLGELARDVESDFDVSDPALDGGMDREMFRRCMNAHGWHVNPKGYAPPEGDEVAVGE